MFKADAKVLRKFILVKIKADRIELAFPNEYFTKQIRIVESKKEIIIKSEKLINQIKMAMANQLVDE
jgi:hypothetical protein